MSGKRLLDTNIIVAFLSGDPQVQERLDAASELLLPLVVLGELYYGAAHSGRPQQNAAEVETFARSCVVLGMDVETAQLTDRSKLSCGAKAGPFQKTISGSRPAPANTTLSW